MEKTQKKFDIIIIGGGPAGLISAISASENGAKVAILEKNDQLGKKLLLTGNGRCNLTQAQFDIKRLVEKYGSSGKFLFPAFNSFGPEKTIEFFEKNNLPIKIEKNNRAFPFSNKAQDVLQILKKNLANNNIKIFYGAKISGFEKKEDRITSVSLKKENGNLNITADKFILATGGKSYPKTGSTGDGYALALELGHSIIKPSPALVPIKVKNIWIKKLQGLSFKDVSITLHYDKKKRFSSQGEIIFTHFGLSGPAILDLSRNIEADSQKRKPVISVDFYPLIKKEEIDLELKESITANNNKNILNLLAEIFPRKISGIILELLEIDPEKKVHSITKKERGKISALLKDFKLDLDGALGFEQAMITKGGINLKEINRNTMQSKIIKNLYFAGEIIDLDGPTGGYNLQIAWSTGHLAGISASDK